MSIESQFEREQQRIKDEYNNNNEITLAEFNKQMQELQREVRGYAEEQAERAYYDTMGQF